MPARSVKLIAAFMRHLRYDSSHAVKRLARRRSSGRLGKLTLVRWFPHESARCNSLGVNLATPR
jgi:hypothetical protein